METIERQFTSADRAWRTVGPRVQESRNAFLNRQGRRERQDIREQVDRESRKLARMIQVNSFQFTLAAIRVIRGETFPHSWVLLASLAV